MTRTASTAGNLRLPALPRVPPFLRPVAGRVSGRVLQQILRRALEPARRDGELDFLEGRVLRVAVEDVGISWCFTLRGGELAVLPGESEADASIGGRTRELLLLASRREDPDTLFFKRRLHLGGDTELGLHVKNLMDRLELEDLPAPVRLALVSAGEVAARAG